MQVYPWMQIRLEYTFYDAIWLFPENMISWNSKLPRKKLHSIFQAISLSPSVLVHFYTHEDKFSASIIGPQL